MVHTESGIIKFVKTEEGLYGYKLTDNYKKTLSKYSEQSHLVDTVKENRMGLTKREFKRAIVARELFHSLGPPSLEDFQKIVKANGVRDSPVLLEDIKNAEKVFGPDLGTLKGKSTRKQPKPVRHEWVDLPAEIPKEFHELVLCIDAMFINQVCFLTAIDKTIKYRSLVPLKQNTADELMAGLTKVVRKYNKAQHRITTIDCDREFVSILTEVEEVLDVTLNLTNADDHNPEIERNNWFLKERFRANFHSRRQRFSRFSCAMHRSIGAACSAQTRRLRPYRSQNPEPVPLRCCVMRAGKSDVTPVYMVPR
jgi:hypothetical protein